MLEFGRCVLYLRHDGVENQDLVVSQDTTTQPVVNIKLKAFGKYAGPVC